MAVKYIAQYKEGSQWYTATKTDGDIKTYTTWADILTEYDETYPIEDKLKISQLKEISSSHTLADPS